MMTAFELNDIGTALELQSRRDLDITSTVGSWFEQCDSEDDDEIDICDKK